MTGERTDTEETDGDATDSGQLSSHAPSSYKVLGELSDEGAVGVQGSNAAGSGTSYGVFGETESTNNVAAGVLGESPGSGANGVMGLANVSQPQDRSDEAGVYGESGSQTGYGVFGYNTSTSGSYAEGVYGVTHSSDSAAITGDNDAGGIGVRSNGDFEVLGNSFVTGDSAVEGSQSVEKTTLSVYLSSNQTIPGNRTRTTLELDAVEADDFGGWDGASHTYTIQEDGDYHVDFGCQWLLVPDGTGLELWITINGTDRLRTQSVAPGALQASRTFPDLSAGDTIGVDVAQWDSADHDVDDGRPDTYLTVHKVG